MPIYADVIVDINSAALDRVFTYELPETGEYSLGTRVKAPFGGRTIEGYIIELKSEPGMDASKVKRVLRPPEGCTRRRPASRLNWPCTCARIASARCPRRSGS